jgi:hypothetical protein
MGAAVMRPGKTHRGFAALHVKGEGAEQGFWLLGWHALGIMGTGGAEARNRSG